MIWMALALAFQFVVICALCALVVFLRDENESMLDQVTVMAEKIWELQTLGKEFKEPGDDD